MAYILGFLAVGWQETKEAFPQNPERSEASGSTHKERDPPRHPASEHGHLVIH